MSTTAARPPQLRLAGQTWVADGPHDLAGMYVMHHAFRRDVDRFAAAVAATPAADREVWQALQRRWSGFADVLHHHHSIEDEAIWPPLLDAVTRDDRAVLEAMEAEHDTIDPQLEACAAGFAAMAAGAGEDARRALDVRVSAARASLLRHLEHEETGALPLVQAHMSVEQWAASERVAEKAFGLRDLVFLLPWVSDGLRGDEWDRTVGQCGPVVRLLHRLLRGRYAARERVAFRYA